MIVDKGKFVFVNGFIGSVIFLLKGLVIYKVSGRGYICVLSLVF